VATEESLYQIGDQVEVLYTYTRVQNTTDGCHLLVGGSAPSGARVFGLPNDCGCEDFGVAALRKF